ncbi:odorant receptor 13a-like [Hylaeus volcanicus]|uniref:odorant receptor 13a-like n=1 Tax=Hylaeus volcanicus TaxID=313075 RepID=UPI0023B8114D|nr:odorant receptor 13a-like [Hylaeus volcanicus]
MNIENYIFINQLVLKFVGLYPINIVRYIVCISCIILIVIPLIAQIYINLENLNILLETSSVLLTISLSILKSLIWMFNRTNLEPFINFMLIDYWKIVRTDVFGHLHEYAIRAKNITKGYLFLIFNALLFFFSLPIIETLITTMQDSTNNLTKKSFPFVALYPLAFYNFPFYEIIYVSQILATTVCGLMILATDTLIATALLHTCGHFKILKENLKQLDSDIYCINSLKNNLKIKIQVVHVIKHHQVILWFCDNMEKNFHLILFLQTMASSLIICFVGFQVSVALMEKSKLIRYFSHFTMALFQLLLFCFPGDILISESSSLNRAVYSIQWYELPAFIKNEVCMFMLRSQKPSYVTAGKIYVMHLENFTSTLSTALSYFMMLRHFNSEP